MLTCVADCDTYISILLEKTELSTTFDADDVEYLIELLVLSIEHKAVAFTKVTLLPDTVQSTSIVILHGCNVEFTFTILNANAWTAPIYK